MKDIPHHLKKLNRKIIRSFNKEMAENEEFRMEISETPIRAQTDRETKKIKKREALKIRLERTPFHLTEEERNRKMKKRVPIFDRANNRKAPSSKSSKKKMPKI
jgi:hypothetical protein